MGDVVLNLTADENARQILILLTDYLEDQTKIGEYMDRLATEYVVAQNLEELQTGRYVRWIKDGVLFRGGIVVQAGKPAEAVVEATDGDSMDDIVMCKTTSNVLMQFHFNECPCFQKLNLFEQWYLLNGSQEKDPTVKRKHA